MSKSLVIGATALAIGLLAGLWIWSNGRERLIYQGKPVSAWAAQLYAPNAESRQQAIAALKAMGPAAVPELIHLLRAKDSFLRKMAWSIPKFVPARLRLFVLRNVRMPNAVFVRHSAAQALGILGPEAKAAVPALGVALRSSDRELQMEAATALARIGDAAVPTLIEALGDAKPELRQMAASALELAGPVAAAAAPALVARLDDEQEPVRVASARALSAAGSGAVPALLHAVEFDRGLRRRGAAGVLSQILPSRRQATPPLLLMMQDPEPASRWQAIETLSAIHASDTNTVAAMTLALKDTDPHVRAAAIGALGKMGARAKPAVAELDRLAKGTEEHEATSAREALEKIGP